MDLYHLLTPNDATNSISFKTTKAVIEIQRVRVVSGRGPSAPLEFLVSWCD